MGILTDEEKHGIAELTAHYPYKSAASIEALQLVQKRRRWIADDVLAEIAAELEMSPAELDSVATFFNLIYRRPVGRHVILLCDSVSCYVLRYEKILQALKEKLGIGFGESTKDDRFTLIPIACLGACDRAPALMIDEDLHCNVDAETIDEILAQYD